jgi:hypothetical protein
MAGSMFRPGSTPWKVSGVERRQMQYFICLTEEGNVTRAARQLNIVQPARSMQIVKLEAGFGKKLSTAEAVGSTRAAKDSSVGHGAGAR